MKTIQLVVLSIFLLAVFSVPRAYAQSTKNNIKNPIDYFSERTEAIGLAKIGKWQKATPLLESLTLQYQNDGDLFYLLGLSYYQTEQYPKAIAALKKTLDCGGTILSGIPSGSAPSNDIMIKIAKAYALDGDKENAMFWLQKGFTSRYDEKPFLKEDPAFTAFSKDQDFLQLFGFKSQENLTRNDLWISDLEYLDNQVNELHHNPYHHTSKEVFDSSISSLRSNIGSLSDEQIVVELMKMLGSLGNGHNLIIPTSPKNGSLKRLPVQLYLFDDGVYIVAAEEDFQQWIGYKVESIGGTPIKEALQKTNTVNARDNAMQTLWLGPYYLGLPDVLEALGIIKNANQVTIVLSDAKKESKELTMSPITWNFTGFPKIPELQIEPQPLFLSKKNDPYWYKQLKDGKVIYIQLNAITNKEDHPLEDFNMEVRNQMAQSKTQNLILDLRHNHGGDGSLLPPILKTLSSFEVMNPKGKIFVIMGRETFSAGHNLLTEITKQMDPILVGEPSGSKPNHIGESGWFQLPYSGLMGLISTQFHQDSKAEDYRKWIAPHIPVDLSSTDYFNGNDKALKVIMEVINTSAIENKD